MKEKMYIDFDGTLFDTDKFYDDFLRLFNTYGIDSNIIHSYEKKIFQGQKLFNLDELANSLVKDKLVSKDILKYIDELYNKNYIFGDVISSLDKLQKKYDLYLLTYGNYSFQMKKIERSNIKKYFKKVIITDKSKDLLENIDYENGIFIENNPIEVEKFKKRNVKKVIRLKRDHDKYAKIVLDDKVLEFKSLKEMIAKY